LLPDGYSILSAIVEGLGGQPLEEMNLPIPQSPNRTWLELLTYIVTIPFSGLLELSYLFSKNFQECAWKVGDERKAWWQYYGRSNRIPVQCIKDIKNTFGVSFTR